MTSRRLFAKGVAWISPAIAGSLLLWVVASTHAVGDAPANAAKPKTQYVFGTEKLDRYQFPTHVCDLVIDRAQSPCAEVYVQTIPARSAPPLHKHEDAEQIFYMLSGRGIATIGNDAQRQDIPVKPGDVIRVPVDTMHSVKATGDADIKYLTVNCFGKRGKTDPTWDEHIRKACKAFGWDFNKVVIPGGGGSSAK